jgi:mono/diheme cytochrome c family protein
MASPLGNSYLFRLLRPLVATCSLALAGSAALAIPAMGQDYRDQGFYQSYVFGAPDEPSEEWLLAYGGRLYDMWWAVLFADPPQKTHPAYPKSGQQSGTATWRCVECHGWDYRGKGGAYGAGPHFTGIKGIEGMAGKDPEAIAKVLRGALHGYTAELIPDNAMAALALFVSKGQVDTDQMIDRATGRVKGDAARGKKVFQNVCAICHDYDGMAWITGEEEDENLQTLGAIANANPWRGLHKVMNGQTYADMPAMRAFDQQVVLDILAYAQTLPQRKQP